MCIVTEESRRLQLWPRGDSIEVRGDAHGPDMEVRNGDGWRPATEEECRRVRIEEVAEGLLNEDVLCCDSALVSKLLEQEFGDGSLEGFGLDDLANLYPDPSNWTVEKCREYLDEHGIDHPEPVFSDDPDELCGFLEPETTGDDTAYVYQAALWCSECGEKIQEDCQEAGTVPADPDNEETYDSDEYPKGPYGDGGGEADCLQFCDGCGTRLENPLTSDGIQQLQARALAETDESAWQEAARDSDPEAAEVFEWWRVSEYLCRALRDIGEVVLDNDYGYWWGRCCTGQAMKMDGTLQEVAAAILDR